MIDLKQVDSSWTLFLDRDGVINHEKYKDYIYNYLEFKFYDGVFEAIRLFNSFFGRVLIVTNQRGVERKLMTEEALLDLHKKMLLDIETNNGKIDAIYYCTSLSDDHPNRKPNPGMALLAKASFPDIDFSKSIMVGDKLSDMQFGRNVGMHTVFVKSTNPNIVLPNPLIDISCEDLISFASRLREAKEIASKNG